MAQLERQLPQLDELHSLMKFNVPTLNRRAAGLSSVANIWDLPKFAERRTPTPAVDYTDGTAQNETTLNRTYDQFK